MTDSDRDSKPESEANAPQSDAPPDSSSDGSSDGENTSDSREPTETPDANAEGPAKASEQASSEKDEGLSLAWWGAIIAVLLSAELFVYGHHGAIRVCVGHKKTDYRLAGQPPTKENRALLPICKEQDNVGMWSKSDERSKEALEQACRTATRLRGADQYKACIRMDANWTRQVMRENLVPWDARVYRRLFWLD